MASFLEGTEMRRWMVTLSLLAAAAGGSGCSSDDGSEGEASGGGQGSGATGGVAPTGGETASGGSPSGGSGGAGTGYTHTGICGLRGEGTVTVDGFEGFLEYYMVSEELVDEGILDEYICDIRFDAARAGDPPDNCGEFAGQQDECLWTHRVELSNPEVITDEEGVCENSTLGMGLDQIAALDGSRSSYGFVSEYMGHNSVLLQYDEPSDSWIPSGNATWDETDGSFRFDRRDGYCNY